MISWCFVILGTDTIAQLSVWAKYESELFSFRIYDAHSIQVPRSIRHFVDIEAGVDSGDDSDSGSEEWDAGLYYFLV
jgi:hypothetical protein